MPLKHKNTKSLKRSQNKNIKLFSFVKFCVFVFLWLDFNFFNKIIS